MTDAPLDITLHLSREDLAVVATPQIAYCMVTLSPTGVKHEQILPLNLAIAVDRSTSMEGERLHKVKTAASLLVEKLSNRDRLAVISYSDRAEVVIPSGPIEDRNQLLAAINRITAGGGTEIYQGLTAAVQQLIQAPMQAYINHCILLTDGQTYGDERQALELASRASGEGIGLSAFGLGSDWNDQFLDQLVTPSGGQSGFIAQPEQIVHFLQQRIAGLGQIHAQNVRLRLNAPPGVHIRDAFKLSPFAQPLDTDEAEIMLGPIEGRSPLSVLLELMIDPQAEGSTLSLGLGVLAKVAQNDFQEKYLHEQVELKVVREPADKPMPDILLNAVRMLNMYRMNEKVWVDMESGNIDAATRRMEHLTNRLREAGLNHIAQHAVAETQRMNLSGIFSSEGRKTIKYGTRDALTSTISDELQALSTKFFDEGDDS